MGGIFDNPKPTRLLKRIIELSTDFDKGHIVLDFFAGSATLAHATLDTSDKVINNRKFICVQIPENTSKDSEALKAGYISIAEIAKERIRRVIHKNNQENPMFAEKNQDLGFRVFKLKHSNFKLWRGDGIENGEELNEQLDLLQEPVREGEQEENMLYELLLKAGYPLTTQVEKRAVGNEYYYLADGVLAIALSGMNEALVKDVLAQKPKQFICLDSLFEDNDQLKTNTQLQFKDAEIGFTSI